MTPYLLFLAAAALLNASFALIATILRGGKVLIPSGNDVLQAGDSAILIVSAKTMDAVRKVLLKR